MLPEDNIFDTPLEFEEIELPLWSYTLVGYFSGKRLPYHAMHNLVHTTWGSKGLTDVILQRNRVYFFRFKSEETLHEILETGLWHFAKCLVFLNHWRKDIGLTSEEPKIIPIWIRLHGVPNELIHALRLSFLVSRFGNPLSTDAISTN